MPDPILDDFIPSLPVGAINPVPDHHASSTFNFDYLLVNGKIFIRSRTPADPKALVRGNLVSIKNDPDAHEWKVFDGIGVPYNEAMESLLAADEQIVEIAVASEIVVAVSNLDRVYLYKPTENSRPLYWQNVLGAPEHVCSDKLFLPHERRAWAFSCSVRTKPEVRTTDFMDPREIVTYFSDANGVHFDFGFTPTIYVLDKDGLKIVYWDTGLPPSFSRGFLVPDGTQGVFISAAGSTIFLAAVDSQGKLHFFTRMLDYEINGACPGLKVSYTDTPVDYPPEGPNGSFFLGHGIRKMPLRGWVEHPVDEILPYITHKVCIRLTGQGDDARELRIQGQDPELGWGYYYKNITEANWTFYPEPMAEPVDSAEKTVLPFNPVFSQMTRLSYTGKFHYLKVFSPSPKITLELKDFHPFLSDAEPFSLIIHHPDESSQFLKIHALDAWGLNYHHKHDEDLVGTVDGEPKALLGTLLLTPEQIELAKNKKSSIGKFLKQYFLDYHGKTKTIPIIANNGMVIVKFGHARCDFERTLSEEEKIYSFYMRKAMEPQLNRKPGTPEECADLIAKNKGCLHEIKSIFSKRRKKNGWDGVLDIGASALRPLASGTFRFFVRPEDPTYEQAAKDLKLLLKAHRGAQRYSLREESKAEGYKQAVSILYERIEGLEEEMKLNYEPKIKL